MKWDEPIPEQFRDGCGQALIFTVSLAMVWLMVFLFGISVQTAFLVQILWIVCVSRSRDQT